MLKMTQIKWFFAPTLTFCADRLPEHFRPSGAPQIVSFTANPTSVTTPGQEVTLSWEISGGVTELTIDGASAR